MNAYRCPSCGKPKKMGANLCKPCKVDWNPRNIVTQGANPLVFRPKE